MFNKELQQPLWVISLLQALGVAGYVVIIAMVMSSLENQAFEPPALLGISLMLTLLVVSASVTGSLVFGYPAYLVMQGKVKDGLSVLAYTLLYLLGLILITVVIASSISSS